VSFDNVIIGSPSHLSVMMAKTREEAPILEEREWGVLGVLLLVAVSGAFLWLANLLFF
jgi:hypothetical protein